MKHSADRFPIDILLLREDQFAQAGRQSNPALKIGLFIETQIVAFEEPPVDIARQVTIESSKDRVTH